MGSSSILDAIVEELDVNGQRLGGHDLVCERRRRPSKSSVEVMCKIIKDPAALLDTARKEIRTGSMKLWKPKNLGGGVSMMTGGRRGARPMTGRAGRF